MLINTDSFLTKGTSHPICQDYCLAGIQSYNKDGKNTDLPYAIISDGCSSSPETDFGSRILSTVARRIIPNITEPNYLSMAGLGGIIISRSEEIIRNLGNSQSLDATLYLMMIKNDLVHIYRWGDGYVIIKKKSGEIRIHEIEYPSGFPYYLNYTFNQERLNIFGQKCKDFPIVLNSYTSESGNMADVIKHSYTREFQCDIDRLLVDLSSNDIQSILVCSDGLGAFVKKEPEKNLESVSPLYIAGKLIAIKGGKGKFLQRRCARMLDDLKSEYIQPMDDFSVAGYYFTD